MLLSYTGDVIICKTNYTFISALNKHDCNPICMMLCLVIFNLYVSYTNIQVTNIQVTESKHTYIYTYIHNTLLEDTLEALPHHKPPSRCIPRLVSKTSLKH